MELKSAIITGASSGIGYELAHVMAAHGFALALVARSQERLGELAQKLALHYEVKVKCIPCDLSGPAAPDEILSRLQRDNFPVSVLVNNAGFGIYGPFAQTDLEREMQLLDVNIGALVRLTKLFLKPMLERREGKILNVASTAAFQPGPYMSLYYASKAFVFSFSRALALELKHTGVTVTTLCPGGTKTEFHERSGMEHSRLVSSRWFRPMSARRVAEIGFRALMNGRSAVVPGLLNKAMTIASRLSPVAMTGRVAGILNQPKE